MRSILLLLILAAPTFGQAELWDWSPFRDSHFSVAKIIPKPGVSGTCVIVRVHYDKPVNREEKHGYEADAVTAYHVIEEELESTTIRVKYRNGSGAKGCRVIRHDKSIDLAVVRVWVPKEFKPATLAIDESKRGDRIEIVGYGGSVPLATPRSFWSRMSIKSRGNLYADTQLIPGDSGGAVFNESGELVAVVSGGWFWHEDNRPDGLRITWPARAGLIKGFLKD